MVMYILYTSQQQNTLDGDVYNIHITPTEHFRFFFFFMHFIFGTKHPREMIILISTYWARNDVMYTHKHSTYTQITPTEHIYDHWPRDTTLALVEIIRPVRPPIQALSSDGRCLYYTRDTNRTL